MRLLKTALFAPGINLKVISKAMTSNVVILDLEDSVPLARKAEAREIVRNTILEAFKTKNGSSQPAILVRVNAIDTGLLE